MCTEVDTHGCKLINILESSYLILMGGGGYLGLTYFGPWGCDLQNIERN